MGLDRGLVEINHGDFRRVTFFMSQLVHDSGIEYYF